MQLSYAVRNTLRTIGTRASSHIVKKFGMRNGLQPGPSDGEADRVLRPVAGRVRGTGASSSKCRAMPTTMSARACRAARSSCGRLILAAEGEENTIIGNTGAVRRDGRVPVRLGPGRRAVRGAQLGRKVVVEGCGSNGCEYMTGGVGGDPGPDRRQLRRRA
jgi:glutamate synthase (NADPH/NADH) large chain